LYPGIRITEEVIAEGRELRNECYGQRDAALLWPNSEVTVLYPGIRITKEVNAARRNNMQIL